MSYEHILYDGARHLSLATLPGMAERTIIVSGVSKSYAWTGGRLGWAVRAVQDESVLARRNEHLDEVRDRGADEGKDALLL